MNNILLYGKEIINLLSGKDFKKVIFDSTNPYYFEKNGIYYDKRNWVEEMPYHSKEHSGVVENYVKITFYFSFKEGKRYVVEIPNISYCEKSLMHACINLLSVTSRRSIMYEVLLDKIRKEKDNPSFFRNYF